MGGIYSEDLVSFAIIVDGKQISHAHQIQSILIEQTINRIAQATITLLDGNAGIQDFQISASDTFIP